MRMRNALEDVASRDEPAKTENCGLDPAVKEAIDKKVSAHDPLKGISKTLLERIRAKQVSFPQLEFISVMTMICLKAAKALEVMKTSPADEKELLVLTQLPEIAKIVRTLFVDEQKGVLPWEAVIEKVILSGKRSRSKGEFFY